MKVIGERDCSDECEGSDTHDGLKRWDEVNIRVLHELK